ncbi:MAG: response regulator transcription factor [Methylobacteriaceae bacterium]|nr:response regulator transcription factor [Methylobacteriaceae bacterium]
MEARQPPQSIVYVVDDDISVRNSLSNLFRSVDLSVETFDSPAAFLQRELLDIASCIVLDIRMPGSSGLDFQAALRRSGIEIPIIFLTAYADIQMSVQAMKAGAVDFLTKPYRDQDLLDAVAAAIDRDRHRRENQTAASKLRARFQTLSRREQEIMALVTGGLMNKQAAVEAGISETTVKIHRGNVMQKMGAKSFADLVRMADTLQIARAKRQPDHT